MDEAAAIPLCVDLDGTLVRTDTLHENMLALSKNAPKHLASLPAWLAKGRASFKHLIAEAVTFDPEALPYRQSVLDLIAEAKQAGRPVVLTTAAPASIARKIADHLGLFDDVLSSDEGFNLASKNKADALEERYGRGGFDYIGDCKADLPVFARARRAYLVGSGGRLRNHATKSSQDLVFLEEKRGGLKAWAKALRIHQWLKNILVFVPMLAAHQFTNPSTLSAVLLAFLSFSLCASSVYILNDLLDLNADRAHRKKKKRPFASGDLPVSAGVVAAPLLLATSLTIALFLPGRFLAVLGAYYVATLLYSFWLKRQVIVDVMLLACLYTVRIVAGAAAAAITLSFWLLALSMFLFLCLALVKRYSELRLTMGSNKPLSGRGYMPSDLPVLLSLGSSSGMASVLILALYTQAEIVPEHYPAAEWLWIPPLLILYWVTRLWLKAQRGEVDDDPVVFAARDWQSLVIFVLMAICFALATSGIWFW